MKKIVGLILLIILSKNSFSQAPVIQVKDTSINNLVLPVNYKTSEYGSIPRYIKKGHGSKTLILIPGWGFDASVFNDFMDANKKIYTMYAITIPGYGNTMAPPLPASGTSYGEQYWNNSVLQGIEKLIEKDKIEKPIIVGHSTQGTQLALRMAIDYPDKVGSVVVLGGHAKFIVMIKGKPQEYTLKSTIAYVDKSTAPLWFKPIKRKDFDEGNFLPEIYSLDSVKGLKLWKQSAAVPLPVMIQYICEFFASDITKEFDKIKCPVLILRAMFNDKVLDATINNYVKPQYIDCWNDASQKNPLIKVTDIKDAATFVWKDNPAETYSGVKEFLNTGDPGADQNAKQIIQKHIHAIGGLKKINSQQSIHTTGSFEGSMAGNGKIEMWMLQNKGFRSAMTKNDTTHSNVMYDHYSWNETTPGGKSKARKIPDALWENMDLDMAGEIVDYEKKGNAAEYMGKENIEGTECYKIRITKKNGKTTNYFIDTKTYFVLQSTVFHVKDGKEIDEGTSRFGDYRKTNAGTMQPFLLMQVMNGKVMMTTKISAIEMNRPIDGKVFEMPDN